MFEERSLLFLYCITPVHAGTGTAVGVIDSPIQREKHTGFPTIAGSGIKGALRDFCRVQANHGRNEAEPPELKAIFGPPPEESGEHAGACSFTDAQIVLFPLRSAEKAFYYVTSPTALGVFRRMLSLATQGKVEIPKSWPEGGVPAGQFVPLGQDGPSKLFLETFQFEKENKAFPELGEWLSRNALPEDSEFAWFNHKLKSDIVLISDEEFSYFVHNATLVEPHVRIDDDSGTADDGGLFYVENLPPESLLVSLLLASRSRKKEGKLEAREVCEWIRKKIDGAVVQLGGDSTTGRGQVVMRMVGQEVRP